MRLIPSVYRMFEGRVASPFWRRLTHLYERFEELRQWRRARRPSAKAASLKNRFCGRPFDSFELQENGSVYLCCPTWLRWRAGNLHDASAAEIWNSPMAQEIRRGILDGTFQHCNHDLCPEIQAGTLPTREEAAKNPRWRAIMEANQTELAGIPAFFNLSNDKSCNLSCPSCRTQRIQFNDGPGYEARKHLQDRLVASFFRAPTDQPFVLNVTGSGDPFASRIFRDFLFELDKAKFPHMQVNLQTNGMLFTEKTWANLKKIHGAIGSVLVSFDAAREETYAITRRGGDWRQLLENMEFLAARRRERQIGELILYFVVQKANFREMPEFVRIGQRFNADRVYFSRAVNWGTWSVAEHEDQSVWNPHHPLYPEFARVVADPLLDDPIVFLGNVAEARRTAMAQRIASSPTPSC
jgi:MoaA/NifB/PqqE/SkfB family radical SAM enzyme